MTKNASFFSYKIRVKRSILILFSVKIDFFLILQSVIDFHIKMHALIDEIPYICAQLSDKDNIHLSATSKHFSYIKFSVLFFTKVHVKDIIRLSYFHQFSDVIMFDINEPLPKHVTNLTFGWDFNQLIKDRIPKSVTILTLGYHFNQPINACIPDSVTNLTFGYYFDQNIDSLSISIINITLSRNYKRKISEKILPKVIIR